MDYLELRDTLAEAAGIAGIMDTTKTNAKKGTPEVAAAYKIIYDDHMVRLKEKVEKAKATLEKSIAVRTTWIQ